MRFCVLPQTAYQRCDTVALARLAYYYFYLGRRSGPASA